MSVLRGAAVVADPVEGFAGCGRRAEPCEARQRKKPRLSPGIRSRATARWAVDVAQASAVAERRRLRRAAPRPPKPISIIAQVAGSGTPATETLSRAGP